MIIDKLKQLHILGSIAVMPDFFVDRVIRLESKEKLASAFEEKAKNGGGEEGLNANFYARVFSRNRS